MTLNIREASFYVATAFLSDEDTGGPDGTAKFICDVCEENGIPERVAALVLETANEIAKVIYLTGMPAENIFHHLRNPDKNNVLETIYTNAFENFENGVYLKLEENEDLEDDVFDSSMESIEIGRYLIENCTPSDDGNEIILLYRRSGTTNKFIQSLREAVTKNVETATTQTTTPTLPMQPSPPGG